MPRLSVKQQLIQRMQEHLYMTYRVTAKGREMLGVLSHGY